MTSKDKPPLLSDAEFLEWCGSHSVKNCRKTRMMIDEGEEVREVMRCEDCRAEAQREADIKHYEGWEKQ